MGIKGLIDDVSRREWLRSAVACASVALLGFGCTKSVTRYMPDGTPYTVEVDDPVSTLAGVILATLLLGVLAAAIRRDEDDDTSMLELPDREDPVKVPREILNRFQREVVPRSQWPASFAAGALALRECARDVAGGGTMIASLVRSHDSRWKLESWQVENLPTLNSDAVLVGTGLRMAVEFTAKDQLLVEIASA